MIPWDASWRAWGAWSLWALLTVLPIVGGAHDREQPQARDEDADEDRRADRHGDRDRGERSARERRLPSGDEDEEEGERRGRRTRRQGPTTQADRRREMDETRRRAAGVPREPRFDGERVTDAVADRRSPGATAGVLAQYQRGRRYVRDEETLADQTAINAISGRRRIKEDGKFGPETERAVAHFQRRHGDGLRTDGRMDEATRLALRKKAPPSEEETRVPAAPRTAPERSPQPPRADPERRTPAPTRPRAPDARQTAPRAPDERQTTPPRTPGEVQGPTPPARLPQAGEPEDVLSGTPGYFDFSSPSPASADKTRQLVQRHGQGGRRVLIGADAGDHAYVAMGARPEGRLAGRFWDVMNGADASGADKHVYLEGPGGETGDEGIQPAELRRMQAGARLAGLNPDRDSNWRAKWNAGLWIGPTQNQIRYYDAKGFKSYEIDNMDQMFRQNPEATVRFLAQHDAWRQENGIRATLMMKNLSPSQLERIERAIQDGDRCRRERCPAGTITLRRSMFSDYHISERGSGNRARQAEITARMGIQTVPSNNTKRYDARGAFAVSMR
ncbi:MAG: peptidoglycan-binding protein [Elusimicrobia bacterium]|nr:peptidoglycan-binding protein [Elusimicrobiota bacterium]